MGRVRNVHSVLSVLLILGLVACSGGGSGGAGPVAPAPPPPPPPPVVVMPDFSAVQAAVEVSNIADMAILIGDETGLLFSYEKGSFTVDQSVSIASASKMVFGLVIWDLIETGDLSRTDNPQDYIDFWTGIAGDARSEITIDQLLGFTSGFNQPPDEPGCVGDRQVSLQDCVQTIYEDGLDTLPGTAYSYGPEHMQIAALMAVGATGQTNADLLNERIIQPLGMSAVTRYRIVAGDNPRYSGAMVSTAQDYGLLLTALMDGRLVSDRAGYLEDRTSAVSFAYRPGDVGGKDWHYGFGFWKECDDLQYTANCDERPTISSPGTLGFTPWIDFDTGYWGIIAMEEVQINGDPAAAVSVQLEQEVQPLIEAALAGN